MADCEATPGLSCDLLYTNSMCLCVYLFVCMWRKFVRISQLFQFQVANRMKNGMCVYDCVGACVCVCLQMVAHICLIDLAAKGLKNYSELLFFRNNICRLLISDLDYQPTKAEFPPMCREHSSSPNASLRTKLSRIFALDCRILTKSSGSSLRLWQLLLRINGYLHTATVSCLVQWC